MRADEPNVRCRRLKLSSGPAQHRIFEQVTEGHWANSTKATPREISRVVAEAEPCGESLRSDGMTNARDVKGLRRPTPRASFQATGASETSVCTSTVFTRSTATTFDASRP